MEPRGSLQRSVHNVFCLGPVLERVADKVVTRTDTSKRRDESPKSVGRLLWNHRQSKKIMERLLFSEK